MAVAIIPLLVFPVAAGAVDPVQDGMSVVAGSVLSARAGKPTYQATVGLAGFIGAAQADATQYPLLDGRCDEYRRIGAEVVAEGDDISVLLFQDADYVWLCYTLPDESYGTLDLVVDSPGLDSPINLHVSAQLGEWHLDHPDEVPQNADSDHWWKVYGWWSNAVSWNGTRETDQGPRANFQASKGRELQLSKTRFGRGVWRLSFTIGGVRNADAGMTRVVLPSDENGPVVVEIF